jgi:hypothetical protein
VRRMLTKLLATPVVRGAAGHRPAVPYINPEDRVDLATLGNALAALQAALQAHELHALYLGALTSAAIHLGPQDLLHTALGDDAELDMANAQHVEWLGVLMKYWNTLLAANERGEVLFGSSEPPSGCDVTQAELLSFAQTRQQELEWYVRGIGHGGDDPRDWGPQGEQTLETLSQSAGFFDQYAVLLKAEANASELPQTREALVEVSRICERLMTSLISITTKVRQAAIIESMGAPAHAHGAPRTPGRNEPCPCGSGKKWKRCCGAPDRVN